MGYRSRLCVRDGGGDGDVRNDVSEKEQRKGSKLVNAAALGEEKTTNSTVHGDDDDNSDRRT